MMNRGPCAVSASVVRRWMARLCTLLALSAGVASIGVIVQRLAASGIVLADRDTAPLLVIAALWLLFFVGLGAAHWRARRAPP
jgi:Ni/Fe-hydrogenase subunit HybB-like protein